MKHTSFSPAGKVALMGLLAATAVVLSFLEGLLPSLPFLPPGAKAGFSNVAVMFTATFWGGPAALGVALIKSMFVLSTRGITAFAMSLCGGLLSATVMWVCVRLRASLIATGILGALTHNTAQLAVAMAITATPGLLSYYPLLLLFAVVAGTITGLLLKLTYPPLCRMANYLTLPQKRG